MYILLIIMFIIVLVLSLYWYWSIRAFIRDDDSTGFLYGIPLSLVGLFSIFLIIVQLKYWRF